MRANGQLTVAPRAGAAGANAAKLEEHFILRLPAATATVLREALRSKTLGDRLEMNLHNVGRTGTGMVKLDGHELHARLFDLPTITESFKTDDNGGHLYKIADISQIIVCTATADEPVPGTDRLAKAAAVLPFLQGLTPPLKNVRKKRFRKTAKRRVDMAPEVQQELDRLLQLDQVAEYVTYRVVEDDPSLKTSFTLAPQSTTAASSASDNDDGGDPAASGGTGLSLPLPNDEDDDLDNELDDDLDDDDDDDDNDMDGAMGSADDGSRSQSRADVLSPEFTPTSGLGDRDTPLPAGGSVDPEGRESLSRGGTDSVGPVRGDGHDDDDDDALSPDDNGDSDNANDNTAGRGRVDLDKRGLQLDVVSAARVAALTATLHERQGALATKQKQHDLQQNPVLKQRFARELADIQGTVTNVEAELSALLM